MKIRGAVLERIGAAGPFADSRPLSVSELTLADPGPGEVLVRVEAAGLCHSDLSVVDGNRPRPVPMLLGHEAAGRIEAVGPDVSGLEVGRRVVMTFLPRCGQCPGCASDGVRPCVEGSRSNEAGTLLGGDRRLHRDGEEVHHHLGVSGFATHTVVDACSVVPVDDAVPADVAAVLGCAVLTGGGAVLNAGRPARGETVAVVGLGGVGMAALLAARAQPDVEVWGVDTSPDKLSTATRIGAHRVLTPTEVAEEGLQADVVVECAGNAPAFETAVSMTGPGGRAVTVGLPPASARASISPLWLVAGGRTVIGSYLGSSVPARDIPAFANLYLDGRLPVSELITSRISLDDVNEGMDRLADGSAIRQVIDFVGTSTPTGGTP